MPRASEGTLRAPRPLDRGAARAASHAGWPLRWLVLLQARRQEALAVPAEQPSGSADELEVQVKSPPVPADPLGGPSRSTADAGRPAPAQPDPVSAPPGTAECREAGARQLGSQPQPLDAAPQAAQGPGEPAPAGHALREAAPEPADAAQDSRAALQPASMHALAALDGRQSQPTAAQAVAAQPVPSTWQPAAAEPAAGATTDTQTVTPAAMQPADPPGTESSAPAIDAAGRCPLHGPGSDSSQHTAAQPVGASLAVAEQAVEGPPGSPDQADKATSDPAVQVRSAAAPGSLGTPTAPELCILSRTCGIAAVLLLSWH